MQISYKRNKRDKTLLIINHLYTALLKIHQLMPFEIIHRICDVRPVKCGLKLLLGIMYLLLVSLNPIPLVTNITLKDATSKSLLLNRVYAQRKAFLFTSYFQF